MILLQRLLFGALLLVALCATVNHAAATSRRPTSTTTTLSPNVDAEPTNDTIIDGADEARSDAARSLEIDRYTSADFHNKVYDVPTSPENVRFVDDEVSRLHTTFRTSSTSDAHHLDDGDDESVELTTPNTATLFDERHAQLQNEIKERLAAEKETAKPVEDNQVVQNNTKVALVGYKHVLTDEYNRNATSRHRTYETEKGVNLHYENVYNVTEEHDTFKVHNDKNPLLNNKIENDKGGNISKRGNTRSPTVQTTTLKAPRSQAQSNLLPAVESAARQEQTQQENNIYPVLVPVPLPTTSTTTISTTEPNTKLYEMTENEHASTTEVSAFEAPELEDETEKFYEMTEVSTIVSPEETTPSPSPTTIKHEPMKSEVDDPIGTTTEAQPVTSTLRDDIQSTTNNFSLDEPPTTQPIEERKTPTTENEDVTTVTTTEIDASINATTMQPMPTTTPVLTATSNEATTFSSATSSPEDEHFNDVTTTIKSELETTEGITLTPSTTTMTVEVIAVSNRTDADGDEESVSSGRNETNAIERETTTVLPTATTNEIKKDNATEQEIDDFTEDVTEEDYVDLRKIKPIGEVVKTIVNTSDVENTTSSSQESSSTTLGSSEVPEPDNSGTIIAIVLSSVGAVCLILLAILLFVMRRRQKRFNYGQRCTPVSLDAYSMDNVSVYNSVRRKAAIRGSKRSYGNPAFDDETTVTHLLNFQAIIRFAGNEEAVKAEFDEIPQVSAKMNELPEGCDTKNRYANIIPLPESRVFLTASEEDPTSDYINANYVTGPKGMRGYYIACQAPMHNTVNDFWRMIWEQQSKVILMLTHLFENGVEKCVDYLPPSEVVDCHRLFGDYQVTLKKREVKDKYIISSLQLKNMVSNSWREVTHLWYSGWPDKGVPDEENSLIAFLIEARSYIKLIPSDSKENGIMSISSSTSMRHPDASPMVVHCSPGTGRTGTVIACDIAIREFELRRVVDIPRIVYRIRRDRASSVQTKDQYHFIYKVINLYATKLTGGALDTI